MFFGKKSAFRHLLLVNGQLPPEVQECPVAQVQVEVEQFQSREYLHDALVGGAEEDRVVLVPVGSLLPGPYGHDQGGDPPVRQAAAEEVTTAALEESMFFIAGVVVFVVAFFSVISNGNSNNKTKLIST